MKRILISSIIIGSLFAYDLNLSTGWQMEGALEDINVKSFSSPDIKAVWAYDKFTKQWRAYLPNTQVDLSQYNIEPLKTIKKGEGFWVKSLNEITINTSNISDNILSYKGIPAINQPLEFHYSYKGNNCSIAFHDGSEEINLDSCEGNITHTFKHEFVYKVELKSDGKVVGYIPVIIENKDDKWIGFVSSLNGYNEENENYTDIVKDGRIYLAPSLSDKSYYWTNYRYIKPEILNKVSGDNFKIVARIKNPSSEGGISCYDPRLAVVSKDAKDAEVTFMSDGCTYWASVGAADWHQNGGSWNCNSKDSKCEIVDLSALGRDFSDWKVVALEVKDHNVSVYYENEKIYTMQYKGKVGNIAGIYLSFKGSGSVDWVKLYDANNTLVYEEDFDN